MTTCGSQDLRLRRTQLMKVATRALGSADAATQWLNRPQPSLGGAVPMVLADTAEGFQRVLDELEAGELG